MVEIDGEKSFRISGHATCRVAELDTQAELHGLDPEPYDSLEKAHIRLTFENTPLNVIEE